MSKTSKKGDGTTTVHGKDGIVGNLPSDKTKAGPSAQIPILSGILERKQEEDVSKIEAQYAKVMNQPVPRREYVPIFDPSGYGAYRAQENQAKAQKEVDEAKSLASIEMATKINDLKSASTFKQVRRWTLTNNSHIRNARLALTGSIVLDVSLLTSSNPNLQGFGLLVGAIIVGGILGERDAKKTWSGINLYTEGEETKYIIDPGFPQRDAKGLFS